MKVLLVNGSPRAKGNTALALNEMAKIFAEEGIETEILHVGNKNIRGCMACGNCYQTGKCVFDDMVNEGVYILIYFKFFSCISYTIKIHQFIAIFFYEIISFRSSNCTIFNYSPNPC